VTFSIVALDRSTGEIGVATQSKFLAVGAVVPWAVAGVGGVATQAMADLTFGPRGLELLARGRDPRSVVDELLARDEQREERQLGMVDAQGRAASFTGSGCFEHAGSATGDGFACQGNILASDRVVPAMAESFETSSGPLPDRLLEALRAAEGEGGDRRGQESAALLVVRAGGGYGGNNDRYVDLRVDDHPDPIGELARLLDLHRLYFGESDPDTLVPVDAGLGQELARRLTAAGRLQPGGDVMDALFAYMGIENLEERWAGRDRIDPVVLDYLRKDGRTAG
jgi:uncharacterized Ntn-hydrolase superfamily protein